MRTVLDIIGLTEKFFREKGLASPRLEAELLLAASLGLKRLDLYVQHDRPLKEAELERLRDWVRRRAAREPWQYLVGEVEFAKVRIRTDRRALIPRPETEELVGLLGELPNAPRRILDLGCGTGAIGFALAVEFPGSEVVLTDESPDALELARENQKINGLESRTRLLRANWFEGVGAGGYDLIVSNPPYLTVDEWKVAEPEVRAWEPESALVGGTRGTAPYEVLIAKAGNFLEPGGLLALETGTEMTADLEGMARAAGWTTIDFKHDFHGQPRFLFLQR